MLLQLTNIARDVVEDAQRGRYYLPREWVEPEVIEDAINGNSAAIKKVDAALGVLLKISGGILCEWVCRFMVYRVTKSQGGYLASPDSIVKSGKAFCVWGAVLGVSVESLAAVEKIRAP